MRKSLIILMITVIILTIISGCGYGSRMKQTKLRTPGGLPRQVPQIDETARGKDSVIITEEMKYPGMTQYEDAKYEFMAADPPDIVAKWFEQHLKDVTLNKKSGQTREDIKWEITYGQYEIDVVPGPHGSDSLIQYKRILDRKKK